MNSIYFHLLVKNVITIFHFIGQLKPFLILVRIKEVRTNESLKQIDWPEDSRDMLPISWLSAKYIRYMFLERKIILFRLKYITCLISLSLREKIKRFLGI